MFFKRERQRGSAVYLESMVAVGELERGRALCEQGAWLDANAALEDADRAMALDPVDLERLAMTAYMLGRLEDYVEAMGRAHQLHLDGGATLPAVKCAFWTGMQLMLAGEAGRGAGWIGRAQRLMEDEAREDCAEQGYLLLPAALRCQVDGRYHDGAGVASQAARIGRRFGDRDLFALAVHAQGYMLVRSGRVLEGLTLLDEAMVAVMTGEVSPIATGMVYCGVILGCREAYEPGRAREWTAALAEWCARQPDMVAFTGRCHVHRAQLRQLEGSWPEALVEARRAAERAALGNQRAALAEAAYLQGDLHRLRGAFAEAEDAYRRASECGREPQPGLALLRLAQGRRPAAVAAIRRLLAEVADATARASHLPACAEIMIAVGDLEAARRAADELDGIARGHDAGVLRTIADQARGAVELADGRPEAALVPLRRAWHVWEELQAPYEAARTRVLIGEACRALEDYDAAAFELQAARRSFERLGAIPDLERLDGNAGQRAAPGLSAREREVLRLVAGGLTNRQIAAELVLSERTVDRHLSNIFAKLRVSSRAAATATAYEQGLL